MSGVEIHFRFRDRGWTHPTDCSAPLHVEWVEGVYDPHGMLLAASRAIFCSHSDAVDLDEVAELSEAYYPGNHVYLWLNTSLWPTEHLRNMPPPDGSSVGAGAR